MKKSMLFAALCVAAGQVLAQAFPAHPVTLVVPFPPGGPSDALARAVAQRMSTNLGQQVVIDNAAGAGGTIGLARVVKSPADGYTLGFGTIGTHVANVALYKKLPYDPITSFEPVGLAGSAPMILVARANLPANNLKEFVAWLQANPKKVSYGSAGVGSISHFGCVMLLSALKQEVTHVPYRGVAPAMNDLMGGQIDFMCDQTTTALPQVAGGKIKAIAVLTDRPLPQLPKVGTALQAGYSDVNVRSWNAIFAPKGTPAPVMQRLNAALAAATADPQLRQQMQAVGVDLPTGQATAPAAVSALIVQGLRRDVPALKARGEYLD
ncbi:MAG: tripartite tricarboxylate transporter substrate-binding protein [Ramlibacter sp.]